MKSPMILSVVAVLAVTLMGCSRDDGDNFSPRNDEFFHGLTVVKIQRAITDKEDDMITVASDGYAVEKENRSIKFKCPCYFTDGPSERYSVAKVATGELVLQLLPYAEYYIHVGRGTVVHFPRAQIKRD